VPKIDINKAAADFNNAVKEGAYIAVGLGVIGFQRAQAQRVEWTKQLESQWEELGKLAVKLNSQLSSQVEAYTESARSQADTTRSEWAEQLTELSTRLEEFIAPARDQLAKLISWELPNLPDFGQQYAEAGHTLDEQLDAVRSRLVEIAKIVDDRVQPARQLLDEQMDRIEERLPTAARSMVQSWRTAAATPEQIWRQSVGLN
jgi:chromosome segregation ATPase